MENVSAGRLCTALMIAAPLVTGCLAGNSLPAGVPIDSQLSAAELPSPVVGDRVYFANGRRERVTGVAGERITWRRSSRTWYTAQRDFTLPELYKQSSGREVRNRIEKREGDIWPLTVGRKVRFQTRRSKNRSAVGSQSISNRDWMCEVDQAAKLVVAAGGFDTYRIICGRSDHTGRLKQQRYWYYAPRIGQPVLRIDQYPGEAQRRLELVAFDPALSGVSESSRAAYRAHFRQTMESVPSGQVARWSDPSSSTEVDVIPVRTLRLESGVYCRNYELILRAAGRDRTGAGLVCRNPEGRWYIPKKVGEL